MFSMNHIHINIDKELSENEVSKIRSIFAGSNCPHESLRATFGDAYRGINDNSEYVFVFGTGLESSSVTIEL